MLAFIYLFIHHALRALSCWASKQACIRFCVQLEHTNSILTCCSTWRRICWQVAWPPKCRLNYHPKEWGPHSRWHFANSQVDSNPHEKPKDICEGFLARWRRSSNLPTVWPCSSLPHPCSSTFRHISQVQKTISDGRETHSNQKCLGRTTLEFAQACICSEPWKKVWKGLCVSLQPKIKAIVAKNDAKRKYIKVMECRGIGLTFPQDECHMECHF